MRIHFLRTDQLNISDWTINVGEVWCVLGNNASGKSQIAALLSAQPNLESATIEDKPHQIALVSFEASQEEYERELARDESDFLDRIDYGKTGLEMLMQSGASEQLVREESKNFGASALLDKRFRQFSTGEMRRLTLLRESLAGPDLLLLDEPYEGLDLEAQNSVSNLIETLIGTGHQILLFANRLQDVSHWCSHVALIDRGKLVAKGPREEVLSRTETQNLFRYDPAATPAIPEAPAQTEQLTAELFELSQVQIRYEDTAQFAPFDWTLGTGDHTLLTGPNGCGKSSLLALLTGDHPQCYSNEIEIFGYHRGSGESIWDIKKHIGYLSPALHRDYRVGCTLETAVISGFFDSIGLYQPAAENQRRIARQWLELFGLAAFADRPFRSLSYGQQRLALIARALVKQPPLVILDEPTQGLDDLNRHLILACLERLANLERTTLLFVSHREDEHISLFEKHLNFETCPEPNTRYRITRIR